ncbi:unnamed protein product, partial [Mesorhabditis spiculigera]
MYLQIDLHSLDPTNQELRSSCQEEYAKWPGKAMVWRQKIEEAFEALTRLLQCPKDKRRPGFLYTVVGLDYGTKDLEKFSKKIQ